MNAIAPALPEIALAEMPAWLIGELRSDHAGETGAVMIYRGILAFCKDPAIRDFAERHGATEQGHLDLLNALLPPEAHSKLLPIWRIAGWMTGAIPALFGPRLPQRSPPLAWKRLCIFCPRVRLAKAGVSWKS